MKNDFFMNNLCFIITYFHKYGDVQLLRFNVGPKMFPKFYLYVRNRQWFFNRRIEWTLNNLFWKGRARPLVLSSKREKNNLSHPSSTLFFNPKSTVYPPYQFTIKRRFQRFLAKIFEKMPKMIKTKVVQQVQKTNDTFNRFESAIVYSIPGSTDR